MDNGSERPDKKSEAFYGDRSHFPFLDDVSYDEMLSLDEMGSRANLMRSILRDILAGDRPATVAQALAGVKAVREARRHVERSRQHAADESDRALQSEFGLAIAALSEFAQTHPTTLDIPVIAVLDAPDTGEDGNVSDRERDRELADLRAANEAISSELDRLQKRVEELSSARERAGNPTEAFELHARFQEEKLRDAAEAARRDREASEGALIPEQSMPVRRWILRMSAAAAERRRELRRMSEGAGLTALMRRADIAIRTRLHNGLHRTSSAATHAAGAGLLGLAALIMYKHPDVQKMLAELFPVSGVPIPDALPEPGRELYPGTGVHAIPGDSLHVTEGLGAVGRGGFSALVRLPALDGTLFGNFSPAAKEQFAWILRDLFKDPELWRSLITFTDGISMSPGAFPAEGYIRSLDLSALHDERVVQAVRDAIAENPRRYARLAEAIRDNGGDLRSILTTTR